MPVIETRRPDIQSLRGVHLYHFAVSNCSQRVRLALEEKGIAWTSHHVNLPKNENLGPEFQALNPNGVVPVLVHDGTTVIESNDIIQYLEQNFDGPVLNPDQPADKLFLEETLARSSRFQPALKLVSHEFLFKPVRKMKPEELKHYAANIGDPLLEEFMRAFSSKEGFGRERIHNAVSKVSEAFNLLEERLALNPWLSGATYGLADISWIVNVHRLDHMNYPFRRHPGLEDWLHRVRARRSFQTAVRQYESKASLLIFRIYSGWRYLRGTSINTYC